MAPDPYTVLNVSRSATADEIRAAYRKLAKKYHPDLNPGNKEAERKFKEINTANEILGDDERRARFDRGEIDASGNPKFTEERARSGRERQRPFYYETQEGGGRYSSAFEGFDGDLFEKIFGGRGGFEQQPSDEHYILEVDFKTSILGAEQELALPNGKSIKVRVPPGIESGKKLRLKGMGSKAREDMPSADVYIEIRVRPSRIFTRNGKNIELEVPVTFYEAMLGAEIRVPTLERPVVLTVPKGSSTGTRLKLKGKGVQSGDEAARGDLIVTLRVVTPKTVDAELENAIRRWSEVHPFNPRDELEKEAGV